MRYIKKYTLKYHVYVIYHWILFPPQSHNRNIVSTHSPGLTSNNSNLILILIFPSEFWACIDQI